MNVYGVGFNPGAEGLRPEQPRLRISPTAVGKVGRIQDPTRDLDGRLGEGGAAKARATAVEPQSQPVREQSDRHQDAARSNRDSVDIRFRGDRGEHIEVRFKGADGRETTVEVQNGLAVPLRSMRLEPPEFPEESATSPGGDQLSSGDPVQLDFTRPASGFDAGVGSAPERAPEASPEPATAPAGEAREESPVESRSTQERRLEARKVEQLVEFRQVELPFETPGPEDDLGGLIDFRV